MINLIPILLLGTLTNNTNNNGYNYKTRFTIESNVCVFNLLHQHDTDSICSLDGVVYFEGDFYCNNANSYMLDVDNIGYSLNYYYAGTYEANIYASYGETINFSFGNNNQYIYFQILFDFTGDGDCTLDVTTDYGGGGNDIVVNTSVNWDYWDDYFSDTYLNNTYIANEYRYDFQNDSFTIDLFRSTINKSLSETENYSTGYSVGYTDGYSEGYTTGQNNGEAIGYNNGYGVGYADGYSEGATQDETATAIMSGIVSVGFIPINFFLAIFNWEVFGINIAGFVSSILSVCVLIIVIKHVFSTNGD